MKQMAVSYSALDTTCKETSDYFRQLHEHFIVEEHRLISPMIAEMDKAAKAIKGSVSEAADIMRVYNTAGGIGGVGHALNDCNTDDLVQAIKQSHSFEQFMDVAFPSSSSSSSETDEMPTTSNDHELLTLIVNRLDQVAPATASFKPTLAYTLLVDTMLLEDIKRQMRSTITLLESAQSVAELDQVLSFSDSDDCTYLLSPVSAEWTVTDGGLELESVIAPAAVVNARGYVYVFGDASGQYAMFSLIDRQWTLETAEGMTRHTGVSACYDGSRHIYICGGKILGSACNKITCYDVETRQFRSVGHLPDDVTSAYSFYRDGLLFIVGGEAERMYNRTPYHRIVVYNIHTTKSHVWLDNIEYKSLKSCCYDGNDKLYMVDGTCAFFHISLATKHRTDLCSAPSGVDFNSLQYVPSINGIIQLCGKGKNFKYSIRDDTWMIFNDYDQLKTRTNYVSCLVHASQ
ncbi:hypothetical protein SAMD00019534_040310 [Acytostelium subglobosum LB1]|uniref:hypothetical protein n=1 Tax=Acytostelium subglobosum LB1 TaxID=1410327 RepID=UPI000644B166|nr:hypothetical protein SAMD00019534_040310 [Acytostelium subglobosum LB1]GAM20856.1 hypothetical protein SAMD00019534_040310 [Acytostelium subglobosum LB1]|eukprot:XP_012755990.1 hypothetical protein SAMD00019534_040310 [Acytostelium subglobosum LB1]